MVTVPTPGPASTTTRVRGQSAWRRIREIRNRLLGTTEPSIRGMTEEGPAEQQARGQGPALGVHVVDLSAAVDQVTNLSWVGLCPLPNDARTRHFVQRGPLAVRPRTWTAYAIHIV